MIAAFFNSMILQASTATPHAVSDMAFNRSTLILDVGLMIMLVVVAFAIVRMRSLFAIVMLQGAYSLLCAAWFVSLDAVDVAFTEAAVGAGISTVLMLGAMLLTDRQSSPVPVRKTLGPLLVVLIAGAAMLYAIPDMPAYGAADSPANTGPGMEYITTTPEDINIPNVVTAVLGSYRGYDTMGEVIVVFVAGIGVLLLLGLNGNAGRWRAQPVALNLSTAAVPQAKILVSEDERPDTGPEPKAAKPSSLKPPSAAKKPAAKRATKKAAVKKPAAKTSAAKTSAVKTPAVKKPAAKKSAAKKTSAKKAITKTAPAKKAAPKTAAAKPAAKSKRGTQ